MANTNRLCGTYEGENGGLRVTATGNGTDTIQFRNVNFTPKALAIVPEYGNYPDYSDVLYAYHYNGSGRSFGYDLINGNIFWGSKCFISMSGTTLTVECAQDFTSGVQYTAYIF